jgi:hypothetical protein
MACAIAVMPLASSGADFAVSGTLGMLAVKVKVEGRARHRRARRRVE